MGKKKLKTTNLSQKGSLPNTIVFINKSLCSYYIFLWSGSKNYGQKINHSGSQMGSFKLNKAKTPPQYWFHISTTSWSASTSMCCPVMRMRKNSNFPTRLIVFLLLFKVLLYILHLFLMLSNTCFFLSTWIVMEKISTLFSVNSAMATAMHCSFFIALDPILWGRCFTSTSFSPHLFLLGWLKLNLALFLDQLRVC